MMLATFCSNITSLSQNLWPSVPFGIYYPLTIPPTSAILEYVNLIAYSWSSDSAMLWNAGIRNTYIRYFTMFRAYRMAHFGLDLINKRLTSFLEPVLHGATEAHLQFYSQLLLLRDFQ